MWPTDTDFERCRRELDCAVVALEELRRKLECPNQRVVYADVTQLRSFIVSSDLWSRVMQELLKEIQGESIRWASWQTTSTGRPYEKPNLRRLAVDELERAQGMLGLPFASAGGQP